MLAFDHSFKEGSDEAIRQGALDALCGVYSIINADHLINGTTQCESEELFYDIITHLDKKKMLKETLTGGMLLKHLTLILNEVIGDRIPYKKIAFAGIANPDLDTFWTETMGFLAERDNAAVLLGFERSDEDWGHWTVARRITPKQMQLFDSMNPYQLKRVNRIHCTTSNKLGRPYILAPAQTYLLAKE